MATVVGADLMQLQALEQRFHLESAAVAELRSRISTLLEATVWSGPAAEQFREEWRGSFTTTLQHLAAALDDNARVLGSRRQAIFAATA
jgi:hypothetical protein